MNITGYKFLQPALKIALFLFFLACLTSCATFLSPIPTPRIPRIAFLDIGNSGILYDDFLRGLRDLGYVERQNIIIEYRSADTREQVAEIIRELVGLQVDVIVAANGNAALLAKYVTSKIPIVLATSGDAVGEGLVASLAHPGGNVTGMTTFSPALSGKRLEVLKETVVGLKRVGVLGCSSGGSLITLQMSEVRDAAKALNLDFVYYDEVRGYYVQQFTKGNVDAILVLDCPEISTYATSFVNILAKNQLPTMYVGKEFVVAGGLMSYGPSLPDSFRRAAAYVDKILKGRKPADLPVELPTKFDFVINLKTAKALGLTIPRSILEQATEVIE